eukprot:31064-Pelagococcus_subviridis.AAC.4
MKRQTTRTTRRRPSIDRSLARFGFDSIRFNSTQFNSAARGRAPRRRPSLRRSLPRRPFVSSPVTPRTGV